MRRKLEKSGTNKRKTMGVMNEKRVYIEDNRNNVKILSKKRKRFKKYLTNSWSDNILSV